MLAAPGMRERTIKIGSAGKMFSLTGWKVGFACAAPALTDVFAKAHQFLTFTTAPHLQAAVAYGLAKPRQHFEAMAADFQRSRDRLSSALHGEGFAILPTPATYFLTVDLRASGLDCTDETFAEHAARQAGIVAIPYAAFYANPPDQALVRLCFAKSDANLDEGAARMGRARTLPMQPSR
jgi:aspartate/methionine/tyrosine aminotransferase